MQISISREGGYQYHAAHSGAADGGRGPMRQIVLFQTFANLILGLAVLFFMFKIDSKLDELFSLERVSAQALTENHEIKELLEEVAANTRALAERGIGVSQ